MRILSMIGSSLGSYDELMKEVIALHGEYVARISHTEKGSEREFYRKLKQEFTDKVNDINARIIKA
mgnify:CR=1 FL=1